MSCENIKWIRVDILVTHEIMEEHFSDKKDKSRILINKRLLYLLALLLVVIPVVVGVVVWHLTDKSCAKEIVNASGTHLPVGITDNPVSTTTTSNDENEPWKILRLPKTVIPVHYDITLYPDFYDNHGWFYGNETVELKINKTTRFILIHANYLNITRTILRYASGENIAIARTFWYSENQFWVIETLQHMRVSTVLLELQFDGSLTRAIVGFYKSTYTDSVTRQKRHLASSKFEPVDARRAFPCMDEPNLKAEYTITLVHRPEYIALSNMPDLNTETWDHNASLVATHFNRSVPMSTYLVCFVVCDFGNLTSTTKYGTRMRVFATPDRILQANYSLYVMKMTMELYQDLFNVSFPLPKNDMIAIPNFVSGAMEHWGLITYREVNMLYDENQASAANKQRVAVVVAHEIAHMWFGNIVTMDWWDDLWLNEGFASFVEYLGVDYTESQWEVLDQMVVDDMKPVMVTDAGLNSHPIVVDVNHPDQINEVFDAISYSKGASIIRMLQVIMGQKEFFNGINRYLTKYKWSNAKTDDLWAELGQVPGGHSVKDVMDTWTRQMGLPYINITYDLNADGTLTKVTATQHRFLADRNLRYNESDSRFRYRWHVPLNYMDGNQSNTIVWMKQDQDSITFNVTKNMNEPTNNIKFNVNETGFYRVNYPDFIWRRFADALNEIGSTAIAFPADRTGLVDDAFNLARGGYLHYNVALEITKYLDKEFHHLPWYSAYSGISYIKDMFINSGKFDFLRRYILQKAGPVLNKLSWDDGTSHLEKLMRGNIIQLACDFGDQNCLGNATKKFRDWIDDQVELSPNIRTYVYKYGMSSHGTAEDWDVMFGKYMNETVPHEQVKLLYGLANTKHVWLLNRYLEYCKDVSLIREQDFFTVVTYISANPVGNSLAWDWVRSNWNYLVDRFSIGSRSLGRLVPGIVSNYNTLFKLHEVEEFFSLYPDAGAGARSRDQARESIRTNIDWMENYSEEITKWLASHI